MGRPVSMVVISHAHADHWCGNQVFDARVPILTTHAIRQEMPPSIAWLEELKADPGLLEGHIREERENLAKETDERRRASHQAFLARAAHRQAALPILEFRFPEITFEGQLTFHGARRTAELHSVAPGHTSSDVYLLLAEDRIMFMGDLGFFQCQPYMPFCDPRAWSDWLAEMEQSEVQTFMPGHGPLGGKADLALQRRYIEALEDLVAQAIRDGMSLEETLERPLPAPFGIWLHGSMGRWEANVSTLYERLSGG
jgi:glyoxylase-like metal-dependent hydrolase (beta-lactamase superfamily II)